jgi:hypothetical protein
VAVAVYRHVVDPEGGEGRKGHGSILPRPSRLLVASSR